MALEKKLETKAPVKPTRYIEMWGVKQNNLKNIEVKIPIGSFTVVCGPSGSGKSSLAFETLYAEGQRRYIESLSNYARQFLGKAPKPDIEGIKNIPPAIAIEQKNSVKTSRSTVGTTTEVIDYIRLLFEKIGQTQCPTYGFNIERESVSDATRKTLENFEGTRGYVLAPVFKDRRVATDMKLLQLMAQEGFLRIYVPSGAKFERAIPEKTTKKKASRKAVENPTPNANGVLPSVGYPPCRPPEAQRETGKIIEIKPAAKDPSQIPTDDFYIVIDRMAFSRDDEGRLGDSIAQAYHASLKFNNEIGGGRATVLTIDGKELCFSEENSCSVCGFVFPQVTSSLFSFNNPVGACAGCNGFGNILTIDEAKVIPNPNLSIAEGALHPFNMPSASSDRKLLLGYCKKEKIDINTPWNKLPKAQRDVIWKGDDKFFGVVGLFDYLETKKYKMHVRVFLSRYKSPFTCPVCKGARLKPESSYVKIDGHTIHEFSSMTIGDLNKAFAALKLSPTQEEVASEILMQVRSRLRFLNDVGVEYLTMDRPTKTLSGGEYQRLNLAKQLGMGLSQTLYVLDEPTVGLHPRDNARLIGILKALNALGNTLVVVEHDKDVIESSDNIIEMGPGSGHLGGEVMYTGTTEDFYKSGDSITVPYLRGGRRSSDVVHRPVDIDTYKYVIEVKGARGHNLKNLNVKFPLNRLVTVTGVSGSGKSTLVSKTLYPAIAQALRVEYVQGQPYDEINGLDYVKNVLFIDQSPIGKTARSNPVTYLKIYDAIRTILASTPESRLRGYNSGTFSLNVDGGRCPVCKGLGYEVVDMMFMDDVKLTCDACDGRKFRREVLEVTYKDKNITEILNLTVSEAMEFFVAYPNIRKPLSFLKEVGLDYVRLGQSASTLSGGESQRLKIAREFIATQQKATLYILDEPTTGLHFREVDMLMKVLSKLVDAGGSVILIEHNMDVIRASDFIIDIGPDAGRSGGEIVAQGTPEDIMKVSGSLTGKYLKSESKPVRTEGSSPKKELRP
jgi:excinuclease ABC subunit A